MADFAIESRLWEQGYRFVAGVDEAGRGPLAGPLVVAAVILPRDWAEPVELDDSKRLSPAQREAAFPAIRRRAVSWRVVVVPPGEIDRVNILRATLAAMARAVERLKPGVDFVLVDGNRAPEPPPRRCPCELLVGGDGLSASIAAASILAKVVRDRLMGVYGRRYPQWGFDRHKGYGTRAHRDAIARHGPSPIHRRSFRPGGMAWAEWETGSEAAPDEMASP